jgi:hypothetical protein
MGFGLTKKIFDSLCVLCGLCEKPVLEGLSLARSLCSLENTEDAEKTLRKTGLVKPQKDLCISLRSLRALRETSP